MYLPESKRLEIDAETGGWNELQFVSRSEFERMAPPVVQLEISRLSALMASSISDSEMYNTLVRLRYNLTTFIEMVTSSNDLKSEEMKSILSEVLLLIGGTLEMCPNAMQDDLKYVADRVEYIYNRISFIY